MALDPVTNFAKVTVSQGYTNTDTIIEVNSGNTSLLPSSGNFNLIWWNATDFADPSDDPNKEIIRVNSTVVTSESLLISRAQEATTATAKNTSGKVYQMILTPTKKTMDDIQTELDDLVVTWSEIPSGAVNGSNKTFTLSKNVTDNNLSVYLNGVLLDITSPASTVDEFQHQSGTNQIVLGEPPVPGDGIRVVFN